MDLPSALGLLVSRKTKSMKILNSKKSIILAFSIILSVFSFKNIEAQTEINASTGIEKAKIYFNGAMIYRNGKASIPQGRSIVKFNNLESSLDINSIQVKAKGNFTILAVNYNNQIADDSNKNPKILALEDSLSIYNRKIQIIQNKIDILNNEKKMLIDNQKLNESDKGFTVLELKNLADFYRTRLDELAQKKMEHEDDSKKLVKKRDLIQRKLNEIINVFRPTTGEIAVEIESKTPQSIQFDINYLIYEAGWHSAYNLNAENLNKPLHLIHQAKVFQNTGIDWKNVKLSLATVNPMANNTKPILHPHTLQIWQQRAVQVYSKSQKAPMQQSETYELNIAADMDAGSAANYTSMAENQLNVEFNIDIPFNIPSDGKEHTVELKHHELKADYKYYAVPKLDKNGFLVANVAEWDDLNLLPGEATLYFENAYIGKTFIDPQFTKDTIPFSLGKDESIVTNRKRITEMNEKSIFGTFKKETFGYEITIRNTKKTEVEITIEDQIPVSGNKEIEVQTMELSNGNLDAETGLVKWKLVLKPGESKTLKLKYSVKYPKDKNINL